MENIKLCEYGCGLKASYQLSNGKWCCQERYNSCPAIRLKNSKGLSKAHQEGRKVSFSKEAAKKGNENKSKRLHKEFLETPNAYYSSGKIRWNLAYSGRKYACEVCGISEWQGQAITLEIDHVNGDHSDNRLENLRYLCPNCHSQTPTFKGRNMSREKKVSDEDLKKALLETSNIRQALIKVGLSPEGANYARAKKLLG